MNKKIENISRTDCLAIIGDHITKLNTEVFYKQHIWNFRPSLQSLTTKKDIVGVEIGVLKGVNSYLTLQSLLGLKKLYLVDPYEEDNEKHYEYAKLLLKIFGKRVEFIRKRSVDAVDDIPDNVDFVYIDGLHDYDSVYEDIDLYWPKVKEGGMLAGHDFCGEHIGVIQAVDRFFGVENVYATNRDWWVIK